MSRYKRPLGSVRMTVLFSRRTFCARREFGIRTLLKMGGYVLGLASVSNKIYCFRMNTLSVNSLLREHALDGMGWLPTRTLKDVVWGLNSLFTVLD